MSKIVVFVDNSVDNSSLMDIKRLTNLPLSEVRQKISVEQPLVEYPLFYNNHEEVAQILRGLIHTFSSHSINARFFEIEEEENILEMENKSLFQIPSDIVLNILDSADRELVRQRDFNG
jgi:hypothetical protein